MNADEILAKVVARISEGGMPAAFEELASILKAEPNNLEALRLRGKYSAMADRWPDAVSDLTAVLALNPKAQFKGMLGMGLRKAGDLKSAKAEYDREIALDPEDWVLYLNRARVRKGMGDIAGAKEDYAASATKAEDAGIFTELAEMEAEIGDDKSALLHLDKAVEADKSWRQFLNRGVFKCKLNQWEAAIRDLDIALFELVEAENAGDFLQIAFRTRGHCFFMLGKEEAESDFDQAILLKPDDALALGLRGTMRAMRGEASALVDLNEAIRLEPRFSTVIGTRGDFHRMLGDSAAAIQDYRKVIELDPTSKELFQEKISQLETKVWRDRARAEIAAGNDYVGLTHLDKAVAEDPGWLNHLERGELKTALKKWTEAISDLNIAMAGLAGRDDMGMYQQKAHRCLGYAKFFQGTEDPMEDLDKALALKPDDTDALCIRGAVFCQRRDARAIRDLSEAIRADPGNALAYAYRGDAHLINGDKPSAASDYRKAIELVPHFIEGLRGKLEEAEAHG